MRRIITIAALFVLSLTAASAQTDPYKLIDEVKANLNKITDYQVDVKIVSELEFIKLPQMKAHVYYKKPNKIKVESDDFAMLPKNAVNFSPMSFFDSAYTAVYVRDEAWGEGDTLSLVNVVPERTENGIVSSIWIDKAKKYVRKIEVAAAGSRIKGEFHYNKGAKVPLPSFMKFSINFDGAKNVPEFKQKNMPQFRGGKGNVKIYYNNYKVNKGIDDKVFDEKK